MYISITNISTDTIYIDNIRIVGNDTFTFSINDQNIISLIEEINKKISYIKIDISTVLQRFPSMLDIPIYEIKKEERQILIFILYWIQSTINNCLKIQMPNETANILENTRNINIQ